ncbi:hypothetical protein DF044_31945 [Burkholderia contaminans]|uniref:hypothetical protein n=1 Tax=Burkholderia TaxID=32008 RepID=UPI0008638753|nr:MULTISPECIES: hypothetical protein [Burkholderia]AOL07243.1 hypothetical protein WI95_25395 [Burkholderia contaminans]ELK6467912.1 hypothetical protein [Burkholderia contaminans]MCA8151892.1 hypothetical protein [Burkholderia contaminans]RQS94507.1 hypothetical protein DF035_28875 [Burkholderia contaminans]RQT05301.1 hypothetical protein DF044_31945 [Burkholderia contaminans]
MEQVVVTHVAAYSADSECAAVTLRCGEHEIAVFSFGGEARVADIVQTPVLAVDCDVRAACLDDWPDDARRAASRQWIGKTGNPYGYRGCGRVIDREQGLINVVGFTLDVGELPCDGAVEFECLRLDL